MLIVILAAGYLRFLASRFLPLKAEKRLASREAEGEIQKINGFSLWTKIFYTKQDGIPYYVIPGGMGMKSQYLVEHLQFMAETNPLYFYDPRGCGRSESKEELAFYQWNQFSEELYEYIQKNTLIGYAASVGSRSTKYPISPRKMSPEGAKAGKQMVL